MVFIASTPPGTEVVKKVIEVVDDNGQLTAKEEESDVWKRKSDKTKDVEPWRSRLLEKERCDYTDMFFRTSEGGSRAFV